MNGQLTQIKWLQYKNIGLVKYAKINIMIVAEINELVEVKLW